MELHIHYYSGAAQHDADYSGSEYKEPWVAFIEETQNVTYNKIPLNLEKLNTFMTKENWEDGSNIVYAYMNEQETLDMTGESQIRTVWNMDIYTKDGGYSNLSMQDIVSNNGSFSFDKAYRCELMSEPREYPSDKVMTNYQILEHSNFNVTEINEPYGTGEIVSTYYFYDFGTMECTVSYICAISEFDESSYPIPLSPQPIFSSRPVDQNYVIPEAIYKINNDVLEHFPDITTQPTSMMPIFGGGGDLSTGFTDIKTAPYLLSDCVTVNSVVNTGEKDTSSFRRPIYTVDITTTNLLDNSNYDFGFMLDGVEQRQGTTNANSKLRLTVNGEFYGDIVSYNGHLQRNSNGTWSAYSVMEELY